MELVNFLLTGLFLLQTNCAILTKAIKTVNIHGEQRQERLHFIISEILFQLGPFFCHLKMPFNIMNQTPKAMHPGEHHTKNQ